MGDLQGSPRLQAASLRPVRMAVNALAGRKGGAGLQARGKDQRGIRL